MKLTHLDSGGRPRMVDVTAKSDTEREAIAFGRVVMQPETLALVAEKGLPKGDVLAAAQVAGTLAAKKTWELIPMCHPLLLTGVELSFEIDEDHGALDIRARVKCRGKTGVEMEALTAVAVAALTIYDMCKAVDKRMVIEGLQLLRKTGGKSGTYEAPPRR